MNNQNTLDDFAAVLYQLQTTDHQKVDCQGMTALHVLLLSDVRDLQKCRMIYDLYPAALITKDNHGETPLNYLIEVSGAEDLLSFFLEMRGKRFGVEYPMIFDKLFKADRHSFFFAVVSRKISRHMITAQNIYNPRRAFLWDELPHEVYCVLVEKVYSRRNNCMFADDIEWVDEHIREMGPRMDYGTEEEEDRSHELLHHIHRNIIKYDTFLLEASTQLEMALWKIILDDKLVHGKSTSIYERMRVHANEPTIFQVVIGNVMKYLQ